jgi:hypothetical protein
VRETGLNHCLLRLLLMRLWGWLACGAWIVVVWVELLLLAAVAGQQSHVLA